VSCTHCDAVRRGQGRIAWSGPLTGLTPLPMKYFSDPESPERYDGDPGYCYCPCHDVWRQWRHLIGSA
jgi:hypothetical protein